MDSDTPGNAGIMNCPICGVTDSSVSFSAHLESHSKQSLIDMLLQQQEALQNLKPSSSRTHHSSGRRSPAKKHTPASPKSSNSRKQNSGNLNHEPITITVQEQAQLDYPEQEAHPIENIETIEQVHGQNGSIILYQLELQNIDDLTHGENNCSIPYKTIQIEDPLRLDDLVEHQSGGPIPMQHITSCSTIHSQEPQQWRITTSTPVEHPSSSQFPSTSRTKSKRSPRKTKTGILEDSFSNERSNSNNTQSQSVLNLMTDEEIPPRGEISEFEESSSNTSSLHSANDDSNNHRRVTGPSLGSLFSSARGMSPVIVENANLSTRTTKKKRKTKSQASRSRIISAVKANANGIICLDCNEARYFNSIFELAQHQGEAHPLTCRTFGTQNGHESSTAPWTAVEKKPIPVTKIESSGTEEEAKPKKVQRSCVTRFVCLYCNYVGGQKALLSQHMKEEHSNIQEVSGMFECRNCGKLCKSRSSLIKHMLVHNGKRHSCGYCFKKFTSNFKVKEHERVHTKIYPFKCSECDRHFRTPSLRTAHIKKVHLGEVTNKPKPEYYCKICCKILRSKKSLTNHMELHSQKLIQKCPHCPETFTKHRVLVRHIRVNHDPNYASKESKDCPVCYKRLHPNSLRSHMRIHNNEKPYSCPMCSLTFRTYSNLSSHSWSHTNIDKPFKCHLCSKSYLFQKVLDAHMMVHKRRTMHFVCNECGVKFTSKANMKRHVQEHYSEKKFKCNVCNKSFHRNYYLVEHQRIHTGVKLFACSICGKNSTTKSNHKAHVKIHDARESGSLEG